MTETCANCSGAATATYELLLRSDSRRDVPLCEDCHEAIRRELSEED